MVSERHDNHLVRILTDDYRERETPKDEPLDASRASSARHGHQGDHILLEQIERRIDRARSNSEPSPGRSFSYHAAAAAASVAAASWMCSARIRGDSCDPAAGG